MRLSSLALAAASLAVTLSAASAQDVQGAAPSAPPVGKQIDEGYLTACNPVAPKELCSCIVAVANAQIQDPAERQIFYFYSTGDVERARSQRAAFAPDVNMKFNVALQQAETMVHNQCDRLRPPSAAKPQP